jgi:hypothetical protein
MAKDNCILKLHGRLLEELRIEEIIIMIKKYG